MTAYLAGSTPRAFAHRGWHIGDLAGCENSLAAFGRAVQEGYRYLETDVHVTADGVLVAFHDYHLDRVTDQRGRVSALTWDEVRTARIGGREPIPLMAEVLDEFPDTRFNIDPKTDAAVGPLIDLLRSSGATDRVGLGSFSDERLAVLRGALGPEVVTSLGPRGVGLLFAATRLRLTPSVGTAAAAQVPVRFGRLRVVTPAFVATAHAAGIMTDRPDTLREVLVQRGEWPS